jgi:hypothetical protein
MSSLPLSAATSANHPESAPSRHYFFVTGETSADLIARVLCPFVKNGVTPYRIHASCENGPGDETTIELRVAGLPDALPELLAAACRRIIGVQTVLTVSE